jgi:hypothetical protein
MGKKPGIPMHRLLLRKRPREPKARGEPAPATYRGQLLREALGKKKAR